MVGLFAALLFLFEPFDFVPPGWPLAIAVVPPVGVVWLALTLGWRMWRPDRHAEVRFARVVAGVVAGMLFIGSYLSTKDAYHLQCTQSVQTRDGTECVGDYVPAPGPDAFKVLLLAGLGATAFWVGMSRDLGTATAAAATSTHRWSPPAPTTGAAEAAAIKDSCAQCKHPRSAHWFAPREGNMAWPCRDCSDCPDFVAA
jgi:hypothetical protein